MNISNMHDKLIAVIIYCVYGVRCCYFWLNANVFFLCMIFTEMTKRINIPLCNNKIKENEGKQKEIPLVPSGRNKLL